MQKPAQPYAFALALQTHAIHAVVPVTGSDEWQAMTAKWPGWRPEPWRNARTALRIRSEGCGRKKASCSSPGKLLAFEEWNRLVKNACITGARHVVGGGEGKPSAIIGDAGADTLAGMRQPPMLNVAFYELSCRSPQQVLARDDRAARRQVPCRPASWSRKP